MKYVSITPEIALDNWPVFAGGLGVLEGDKFMAASRLGVDYTTITLLHKNGYAEYAPILDNTSNGAAYRAKEITRHPENVMTPEVELTVDLGSLSSKVTVRPWRIEIGSAKAIYLEPTSPEKIVKATQKLYSEDSEEDKRAKYALLAKAAAAYITGRIGTNSIKTIDLQEAFSGLCALTLPESLLQKTRLIIHTSGEWGHPCFPRTFLEEVFGYKAKSAEDWVMLTEIALERVSEAFAVSEKHWNIVRNTGRFERYKHKINYVTNGVDLERWTHPEIAKLLCDKQPSEITPEEISKAHQHARTDLISLMRHRKPDLSIGRDTLIVSWPRRFDLYKRMDLVERLINDTKDMGIDVAWLLAGKSHPKNEYGLSFMTKFKALGDKYTNVLYLPDYDIDKAKVILSGSDLLLFTPFSGVESSGTSYMKAGVNGVPTLAARDGSALEVIIHGQNGWFFGKDLRYCTDLNSNDERAHWINEEDYREMKGTFLEIIKLRKESPTKYNEIMVNALESFREKMDITRTLEGYGIITRASAIGALPGLRGGVESAVPQKLRSINA